MAVLFIRKPSETPNIQNIDDIRMVRYAYGNQNGYIKGYGAELSHNITGSTFIINSGIFVVQGAEVKIDANGWSESVSGVTNKRYYTVYGEVNLALQTAEIKSTYSHATYPTVEAGDDLTQSTDGTARVELYRFTATNGIIADVVKVVKGIDYSTEQIAAEQAARAAEISSEASARINADMAIRNDLTSGALVARTAQYSTTQAQSDNSTRIATTAYVRTAISNFYGSGAVSHSLPSATTNRNIIKRQGNLVLLDIEIVTGGRWDGTYNLTVPAYCTSGNTNLYLRPSTAVGVSVGKRNLTGTWYDGLANSHTLLTSGVISISFEAASGVRIKVGYEIT